MEKTIEEIIEAFGNDFDEVRRSPMDHSFVAYLADGRRATGITMRDALQNLLEIYELQGKGF